MSDPEYEARRVVLAIGRRCNPETMVEQPTPGLCRLHVPAATPDNMEATFEAPTWRDLLEDLYRLLGQEAMA